MQKAALRASASSTRARTAIEQGDMNAVGVKCRVGVLSVPRPSCARAARPYEGRDAVGAATLRREQLLGACGAAGAQLHSVRGTRGGIEPLQTRSPLIYAQTALSTAQKLFG